MPLTVDGSTKQTFSDIVIAAVDSDIIPDSNNVRSLGSVSKKWANAYAVVGQIDTLTSTSAALTTVTSGTITTTTNGTLTVNPNGTGTLVLQTGGVTRATLSSTGLTFASGQHLTLDTINSIGPNGDLALSPNGTGVVTINSNGVKLSNATASYVPSALTYYEENSTVATVGFTGAFTVSNLTIKMTRVGNSVTFSIPTVQASAVASTNLVSTAGIIPARFRPSSQFRGSVAGVDGGANTMVLIDVDTGGTITFSKSITTAAFTSGGSAGPYGTFVHWLA